MKKILILLLITGILSSCGPRWYYPNLDWLIPWYVDDYVSLNREQKTVLGERLDRVLDWHCRTQLFEYAAFLREIRQQAIDGTLTFEKLAEYNARLARYWSALIARIGPEAVQILDTATEAQIQELFENLEQKNQELQEKFVDPPSAEIIRNRQERMEERLQYWFSDLNGDQKTMVAEWSRSLLPISADWIDNRRKLQRRFRQLLEQRGASEEFESAFLTLLSRPETIRSEKYRKKIEINTERTLQLLARLVDSLTAEQRNHFSDRLESLARDLEALGCEPVNKPPA